MERFKWDNVTPGAGTDGVHPLHPYEKDLRRIRVAP